MIDTFGHEEAVVAEGADQDIWDKLWEVKSAGIATFGTESGTALDSQGNPHTVNFSRATPISIWMHAELKEKLHSYHSIDGHTEQGCVNVQYQRRDPDSEYTSVQGKRI